VVFIVCGVLGVCCMRLCEVNIVFGVCDFPGGSLWFVACVVRGVFVCCVYVMCVCGACVCDVYGVWHIVCVLCWCV